VTKLLVIILFLCLPSLFIFTLLCSTLFYLGKAVLAYGDLLTELDGKCDYYISKNLNNKFIDF